MHCFSLYCDACESLATSKTLKAKLLLDGKPIGCGDGLQPGIYNNLELVFCLPELDDILQSQGLTREAFKSLTQANVSIFILNFPFIHYINCQKLNIQYKNLWKLTY